MKSVQSGYAPSRCYRFLRSTGANNNLEAKPPEPGIANMSSTKGMKLDKTEVARRQLGTALALFIEDLDPISVHTLARAGGEIAEHLTRKAMSKPFIDHALATFPDETLRKIRGLQNRSQMLSNTHQRRQEKKGVISSCFGASTTFRTTTCCLSAGTTTCLL
jgi:hypothetical protein